MNCETTRFALSAALDGEDPGADSIELGHHLDGCPECREWREAAHELRRRARIVSVTGLVAPSTEVLDHIRAEADRPRSREVDCLRLALLVVMVGQVAVSVALLLFGSHDLQRDMGASSLALAVGFGIVALRPGRAFAISPVVGTAAALLVLEAVIEVAAGKTHLATESPHAITFAGWLLVHRIGRLTPPTIESPERLLLPSLRRWIGQAASEAYADFTHESRPAGGAAWDEPAPIPPGAGANAVAGAGAGPNALVGATADVALRRGAA